MLMHIQRYFRFYLASFLFAVLLIGIRWQAAPLGAADLEKEPSEVPAVQSVQTTAGIVAIR